MQHASANATHPSASVANLGLVLLLLTFATYGLKYVVNLLFAKNMPPEVYGDLSLALRLLAIAAALTLLGTGTSAKRFLAKYLQTDRPRGCGILSPLEYAAGGSSLSSWSGSARCWPAR